MKLWLIEQDENIGYDVYDSAVVAADTEEEARGFHPSGCKKGWDKYFKDWATSPDNVRATELGEAIGSLGRGVVLASFNAG